MIEVLKNKSQFKVPSKKYSKSIIYDVGSIKAHLKYRSDPQMSVSIYFLHFYQIIYINI